MWMYVLNKIIYQVKYVFFFKENLNHEKSPKFIGMRKRPILFSDVHHTRR